MPRTRRTSSLGLTKLDDNSNVLTSENNLTPNKQPGKKKKKRTVSDRSPAVVASRKKTSVDNADHATGDDNKENTDIRTPVRSPAKTQRPTPYWKIAEERGTLSPRITRSSSKRPCRIPRADDSSKEEVTKGLFQLEFSPPDPDAIRKRELQIERDRDERLKQQKRQEGSVMFLSPNAANTTANSGSDKNQICLELSPEPKFSADSPMVRTSSASSSITYTSSHMDELKARNELEKVNAALKTENIMLSKSLTKAEKGLEKIGLEKERLIIEKTKLEGQIHSFLNPEWNKGNQDVLSRAQELEEKVGKFNSIRTESEIHARMTELEKDNEKLRKVIEVQKEDMKRQAAEREDSLAAIDEGAAEIKLLKAELEKKESDPAMAEVIEKGAEEIKFLKAELEKKKVDPAMAEAVEKGAAEIKFLKAELEKKKPDPAMAEAIEKGAAEIEFLKAELEKKNSDLAILEGRYKELEMSAQQEESKNIAANEKISEQEAEIEELCEQNETNEKITEELRYQITSLKNSLTNMKHTLEAKFASCEKDRIELSTKVDKLTAENQTYQNEIESLRKEHKKYLEQCNDVKVLLDQSSNRTHELKSQQQDLKLVLSKTVSENELKEKRIVKMMNQMSAFNGRESELLQKIVLQEEVRRSLHNRVIQLSGNIRVFIRVRPCIESELVKSKDKTTSPFSFPTVFDKESSGSSVNIGDDLTKKFIIATEPFKDRGGLSQRRKRMKFGFDNVFSPANNNEDVWAATEPLVQSAVDGYNVCVFAYGQTGSGKSYTMLGGGDATTSGIVTKAIETLYNSKRMIEDTSQGERTVDISIELLEIYNEQVRDLMSAEKNGNVKKLNISVHSNDSIGNIIFPASDDKEALSVLTKAQERRCVKATDSNEESSRSHLIITMNFVIKNASGIVRKGKLHICDLAGSERLSKSNATGSTLNETKHINKSLSILSNVIEKLQQKSKHVPFRESKLTYLLRNSLGGDSKTLAIVCCNPLAEHFQETSCSLRFAQKLNKVELQAMGNISC